MTAPATHRSEAACEAELAYRALVRMVLWLDAADLEVSEACRWVHRERRLLGQRAAAGQ